MNSKIRILNLVVFLFLVLSSVPAQIGIKGGIGISDIAFLEDGQAPYLGYEINSLEHRIPRISFQAGAFGTAGPWKRIELQPELLYSLQGLNYSTEYLYDDITYKINISYLKMPLLLKYIAFIRQKRQAAFFIGPYASLKLNAVLIMDIEGVRKKSIMTNVKDIDLGADAGFSVDLNLPAGKIILDLRCSYSLINMMDRITGYIPWYYGPSKEYARNVNISLTAGYRFSNIWSNNAVKHEKIY
jgi:hypothetical protein